MFMQTLRRNQGSLHGCARRSTHASAREAAERLTDNACATGQARKHMHKQLLRVKSEVLQKATLGIRTRRQNWASEWGTWLSWSRVVRTYGSIITNSSCTSSALHEHRRGARQRLRLGSVRSV